MQYVCCEPSLSFPCMNNVLSPYVQERAHGAELKKPCHGGVLKR